MKEKTKSITFTINPQKHRHILQKLGEERDKEGISRYLRLLIEEDIKKDAPSATSIGGIRMNGLE